MKVRTLAFLFALALTALAVGQQSFIAPETVIVPNGKLHLEAFLWKPTGPGPFPAVLFCHGSGGADSNHMLIQASNDYSTAPSYALADELERLHKPDLLKIHPPVGQTSEDGHNLLYLAIPQWSPMCLDSLMNMSNANSQIMPDV